MNHKTMLLVSLSIFFCIIAGIHFLILYNLNFGLCAFLGLYTGMFMQILFGKGGNDDNKHTTNPV